MRVGILSQWYPPEPASIPGTLAPELVSRGHQVRVLTGYPNYPGGRLYPGYRQRWRELYRENGVLVRRVPLYPSHDANGLRRAANYLSFAATSTVAGLSHLHGAQALYVYHPPATAFAGAALLRLVDRVPVVLHVQDIWPDSVTLSPMSPGGRSGRVVHQALSATMRRVYRAAHSIAVIAPSMKELLVERGADPEKVHVVLNWADERLFHPAPTTGAARRELGGYSRRVVVFAGNLGAFQGLETAVRAAAAAEHVAPIDLVIIGSGTAEASLRRLVADLGAGNIRFLGRRSPEQMAPLYAAADFQLVCLRDLDIFRGTVPSKLQAALACGAPVIVAVPGDAANIVNEAGCGLVAPPEDWKVLANRFIEAGTMRGGRWAEMAHAARETYTRRMSLRVGVGRLEALLTAAAGSSTVDRERLVGAR
ncbi:glycosyltransferase WbuB [Virgisporangium aliadipatigenens]|uniref:Glycosyltransferase WbuB n=1 Tax=Virgisporangium aliadipatigenens TaxID=741659 RepID=A0A8J4DWH8_9ACTN|nr:glycosyltransferase family 4 protein [Virgisporangium aliadipatigenens]GIJ52273.1 glycosyltransferase WbuB [Virgisporangium aliadipatigenens]